MFYILVQILLLSFVSYAEGASDSDILSYEQQEVEDASDSDILSSYEQQEVEDASDSDILSYEQQEKDSQRLKRESKIKRHFDNLFYFENLTEEDLRRYEKRIEKEEEKYEKYQQGEPQMREITASKFTSKLLLYELLSHYDEQIDAYLERHPRLERALDYIDVKNGRIVIYLYKKEF